MAWRSDGGILTGAPENAALGPGTRIFGGLIGGLIWRPQKDAVLPSGAQPVGWAKFILPTLLATAATKACSRAKTQRAPSSAGQKTEDGPSNPFRRKRREEAQHGVRPQRKRLLAQRRGGAESGTRRVGLAPTESSVSSPASLRLCARHIPLGFRALRCVSREIPARKQDPDKYPWEPPSPKETQRRKESAGRRRGEGVTPLCVAGILPAFLRGGNGLSDTDSHG